MNKYIFSFENYLKLVIVVLLLLFVFVDGNILNSLMVHNDISNNLVIEEMDISFDNNDNENLVQLMGQVVVNDKEIVEKYATVSSVANINNWVWPTDSNYVITSYFGYRWGGRHDAIDISGPGYGSNIYAANNGVVVSVKGGCSVGNFSCNGRGGNYIVIDHNSNNYYTIYMHLKNIFVGVGDVVSGGEVIGTMGNTGNVYPRPTNNSPYNGTHLHFGLYVGEPYHGGYAINPLGLY